MSNRDLEIMADERLQAEAVALREKVRKLEQALALATEQQARFSAEQDCQHWRERCEELRRLLFDCWLQFSYLRADYTRHSGGQSTLEWLRAELLEAGMIDEAGRVVTR
jgi:hypothetical protein